MTENIKILVTGGEGWIGTNLVTALRQRYGTDKVISADICQRSYDGIFEQCDISDFDRLKQVVEKYKVTWLFNMAALLSLNCENNHLNAFKVNVQGFQNVMEVARMFNLRILHASSIGSFGPGTPMQQTPDVTIQRPPMLYGCTKVYNELVGEWYFRKFSVDFRSLRYPVILDDKLDPNRISIVSFAPLLFQEAVRAKKCEIDVANSSCMCFCHIEDCVDGTIKLMEAASNRLTLRTYNMMAFSATVGEMVEEIQRHVKDFTVSNKVNKAKQPFVDALVDSVDDSNARNDWGWNPKLDLVTLVREMLHRQRSALPQ